MKRVWMKFGGVAGALVLALLSAPAQAADQSGLTTAAATELGKRSKPEAGENGGLSDSAVRIMLTYAFSLVKGPDGTPIQVDEADKSVLDKYAIPIDSARRVIRGATRSAYADICNLPELGEANFKAMVEKEQGLQKWSSEQVQMINALYLFAVSYFTGNVKITAGTSEDGAAAASQANGSGEAQEVQTPAPPKCPPEQKKKVESAIKAYVASVEAN